MFIDDKLKSVEANPNAFQTQLVKTTTTLTGPNLFFTKASRTDLTVRPYGNLFASFNLPLICLNIRLLATLAMTPSKAIPLSCK